MLFILQLLTLVINTNNVFLITLRMKTKNKQKFSIIIIKKTLTSESKMTKHK